MQCVLPLWVVPSFCLHSAHQHCDRDKQQHSLVLQKSCVIASIFGVCVRRRNWTRILRCFRSVFQCISSRVRSFQSCTEITVVFHADLEQMLMLVQQVVHEWVRCSLCRHLCAGQMCREVPTVLDHRIIECHKLHGSLKIIQFQVPAMRRVAIHQLRLLMASSNLALNASADRAPTASLSGSARALLPSELRISFYHLNLHSFSLKPFLLIQSLSDQAKCMSPSFL